MGEIDLQERFPDMKPISRPPSLGRVNGIGFGIYGHRDDDPETGTYVTTLAFSFLWIPLLALGAYRVAPADGGGWYFLGKVPLSSIAKLCNILVLLACVSFGSRIAWKSYQDRPEVRAANQMARADELVEDGKLGDAAKLYRELARGSSAQAVPARTALHALVRDRLITASDADALRVVKAAIAVQRKSPSKELEGVRGEVAAAAEQRAAKDPAGALRLLQAVEDFGTPTEAETALHHKILELLVAGEPTNLDYCAALAGLYEAANELDRCRALLEPLRDRLGGSEGARILGQLEVQEGNLEAALALLSAYVTPRLQTLHSAQSEYDAAWTAVGEEALARLNRDLGPPRFYRDYERANEAEKQRLVEAELEKAREGNWELEQALDAWRDAASVVPAALDLGLVHLRLGQQAADPAERERQLKTAERVFLATRAVSGESDEYRMFLGQVYYWLGRAEEGEKLFAELLKTHERAPGLLVQLCSVMRQLGAFHKAVELAEEAFGNQPPGAERQNTAYLLAMTVSDEEKKIMWLEQADPENVGVRAALSFSKGVIAHDKGNRDEATRLLREAVDAYAAMPADVGSLHNGAVACLRLGSLEFDPKLVDRAIDMLERAHRLNPDSAITMNMLASGHWERALGQLVSSKLDLKALQLRPNQAMCSMMYADPRGRDAFAAKLAAHRDTHRARVLLEQARAIAPKNVSLTTTAFEVEGRVLDVGAMRKICDDVARVRPDLGQSRASILERYTDDARKKSRESRLRDIARQRAVLAGLPEGATPETRAWARVLLMYGLIAGSSVGVAVDPEEVDRLATEARRLVDASTTQAAWTEAALFRAHRALLANETYRRRAERLRGALGPTSLIVLALEGPDSLARAVAASTEVKAAVRELLTQVAVWPSGTSPKEWAVIRAVDPKAGAAIAKALAADERDQLAARLERELWCFFPESAMHCYCWAKLNGDEKDAAAVMAEWRAGGAPAPR